MAGNESASQSGVLASSTSPEGNIIDTGPKGKGEKLRGNFPSESDGGEGLGGGSGENE
ncbi:hypothetical protein Q8A73_007069 [Channa argus]|nr:hypothetical protein Q8A73_007069 [Channa argus]